MPFNTAYRLNYRSVVSVKLQFLNYENKEIKPRQRKKRAKQSRIENNYGR